MRQKILIYLVLTLAIILAFFIGGGRYLFSQTNMGPIRTPQINQNLYVGQSGYATIQSAVTFACRTGNQSFAVIILPGVAPNDSPATVTGGCIGTYIADLRQLPHLYYQWTGTVYLMTSPITGITYTSTGILNLAAGSQMANSPLCTEASGCPTQPTSYPPAGIGVSTGTSWSPTSINPATLATWPAVGLPVSTGTSWGASIDPNDVPRLSAAQNTFQGIQQAQTYTTFNGAIPSGTTWYGFQTGLGNAVNAAFLVGYHFTGTANTSYGVLTVAGGTEIDFGQGGTISSNGVPFCQQNGYGCPTPTPQSYPPAGLPVSTGSGWGTSIDPTDVPRLSTTTNQTFSGSILSNGAFSTPFAFTNFNPALAAGDELFGFQTGLSNATNAALLMGYHFTGVANASYGIIKMVNGGETDIAQTGLLSSAGVAVCYQNGVGCPASAATLPAEPLTATGKPSHTVPATPKTSKQTCRKNSEWHDDNFLYICIASGNVKRVALSSF